jgi:hypothetical protein
LFWQTPALDGVAPRQQDAPSNPQEMQVPVVLPTPVVQRLF